MTQLSRHKRNPESKFKYTHVMLKVKSLHEVTMSFYKCHILLHQGKLKNVLTQEQCYLLIVRCSTEQWYLCCTEPYDASILICRLG